MPTESTGPRLNKSGVSSLFLAYSCLLPAGCPFPSAALALVLPTDWRQATYVTENWESNLWDAKFVRVLTECQDSVFDRLYQPKSGSSVTSPPCSAFVAWVETISGMVESGDVFLTVTGK